MKIKIKKEMKGDIAILHLSGDMLGGPASAERFPEEIKKIIEEGINKVVVDLEKVKRMNSTGLGILMQCYTSLKNKGGNLRLASINKSILGVLVLTKLNTIFDIHETLEEALSSF